MNQYDHLQAEETAAGNKAVFAAYNNASKSKPLLAAHSARVLTIPPRVPNNR